MRHTNFLFRLPFLSQQKYLNLQTRSSAQSITGAKFKCKRVKAARKSSQVSENIVENDQLFSERNPHIFKSKSNNLNF